MAEVETKKQENNEKAPAKKKGALGGKKGAATLMKRYGGSKAVPKNTQQVIPYLEAYENGVLQIEPGVFSMTYAFDDISFKTKSDEEQNEIYAGYMRFLNTLREKEDVYISFVNTIEDERLKMEKIIPIMKGDKFDPYRQEMSEIIRQKMLTMRNSIETRRYLTVVIEEDSVDKAMQRFDTLMVPQEFRKVTKESMHPIDLAARLEILSKIFNGAAEKNYWFEHDADGNTHVDFAKMAKQGLATKDLIAPESFKWNAMNFEIGGRMGQAMYLSNIANWMNTNFLADLCSTNFEGVVTMHIEALPQDQAVKLIHNQSVNITGEVMEKQKNLLKSGYSPEFISADLKHAKDQIDQLQEDLMNRDQRLFYMSVCLLHFAGDLDTLKAQSTIIKNMGAKYMCSITPLAWQQMRGFTSALPIGLDRCYTKKLMTTESLGVFIPFDEMNQFDDGGHYYGVNAINKSLIVYNRCKGQNYNGLVLGASGSGKSFSSKREMVSTLLTTNNDVCIIDPDGEYTPLADAFDGSVIKIAPGNGVHLNPFDLDIDTTHDSDMNPITMKTDFVCGMLETMIGNGASLTPVQKSIVDRCIQQIYAPYLEYLQSAPPDPKTGKRKTIDKDRCPTMQSLYQLLLNQTQPEAQNLALVMETYTTGTFDTFAHRTNVDVDNRLIVYDIKNIGTNLKELALKVCTNDVWNKIVDNRKEGKWTWFYVDEFHLLFSNSSTSEFLKSIWKRARKWQGVPTGITQNVEDLLLSPAARAIINNSSFVYMLNQSAMDRGVLADILHLSANDVEYVTNVEPGHGLIYTGKQAIPFVDNFPKDTALYKIMSTRAEE